MQDVQRHDELCYRTLSACPKGEWSSEPNRLIFRHVGLFCVILRDFNSGYLKGFVGVPEDHRLYGCSDLDLTNIDTFGGAYAAGKVLWPDALVPNKDLFFIGIRSSVFTRTAIYAPERVSDPLIYTNIETFRVELEYMAKQLYHNWV